MIRHGRARKVLRDFTNEKFTEGHVKCRGCGAVAILLNPFGPREVDECEQCAPSKHTPEACPKS